MNWYHRAERRYVEYGSSFEATRAFGLFRSLYDTVYNMNMAHLSDEVETVFERLGDARRPHRVHAVSDLPRPHPPRARPRGPAAPGRARGDLPPRHLGTRRALLRRALLEPQGAVQADAGPARHPRRVLGLLWARAGRARPLRLPALLAARQRLPLAPLRARRRSPSRSRAPTPPSASSSTRPAGWTRFLDDPRGDPGRRPRADPGRARRSPLAGDLGERLARAAAEPPSDPERRRARCLPDARGRPASTCCATGAPRRAAPRRRPRAARASSTGSTCSPGSSTTASRSIRSAGDGPPPAGCERGGRARRQAASLPPRLVRSRPPRRRLGARRRPGGARRPSVGDAGFDSDDRTPTRSPASGRRSTHRTPASPDLGRARATSSSTGAASPTARGGSHGALAAGDSLGPLLLCGLEPGTESLHEQWAIRDVAELVLGHFGLGDDGVACRRRRGRGR